MERGGYTVDDENESYWSLRRGGTGEPIVVQKTDRLHSAFILEDLATAKMTLEEYAKHRAAL